MADISSQIQQLIRDLAALQSKLRKADADITAHDAGHKKALEEFAKKERELQEQKRKLQTPDPKKRQLDQAAQTLRTQEESIRQHMNDLKRQADKLALESKKKAA
jgi:hypothetical protein